MPMRLFVWLYVCMHYVHVDSYMFCMVHVWCQLFIAWWRHEMETFSALLAFCAGNSPVTGEFPTQRPVTRSFDVFFELWLSKQSWGWWSETPSSSLWRHCIGKAALYSLRNNSIYIVFLYLRLVPIHTLVAPIFLLPTFSSVILSRLYQLLLCQ